MLGQIGFSESKREVFVVFKVIQNRTIMESTFLLHGHRQFEAEIEELNLKLLCDGLYMRSHSRAVTWVSSLLFM